MDDLRKLDPELIRRILNSTVSEDEQEALKQQALASQLGQQATRYNPNYGGGAGGAMGAMAQGLQGYMSGSMDKSSTEALKEIGKKKTSNRADWYSAMYPQKEEELQQLGIGY